MRELFTFLNRYLSIKRMMGDYSLWLHGTGQEAMVLNCSKENLGSILGRTSLLREWLSIGTHYLEKLWTLYLWILRDG